MKSTLEIFDLDQALDQTGGNRMLAMELFSMLVRELPTYLEKIRQQTGQGDGSTLMDTVHELNGAACYCGVPALRAAAMECESLLKDDLPERNQAIIDRLINEIDLIIELAGEDPNLLFQDN